MTSDLLKQTHNLLPHHCHCQCIQRKETIKEKLPQTPLQKLTHIELQSPFSTWQRSFTTNRQTENVTIMWQYILYHRTQNPINRLESSVVVKATYLETESRPRPELTKNRTRETKSCCSDCYTSRNFFKKNLNIYDISYWIILHKAKWASDTDIHMWL